MSEIEKFYPRVDNLGKECTWWNKSIGCTFPKAEMEGRTSCEGIIDDVCLYLKDGRKPASLSSEQILMLKTTPPSPNKLSIPPGDITKE